MARLRLRPLRDDELPGFLRRLDDAYRTQLVELTAMAPEDAREKAARDHADLFPGGRPAQGLHALAVVADEGRVVGSIVYALRAKGQAWLYWIEIDASERGRGYGTDALRLFEEHAREDGARELGLNVFAANEAARSLYRASGWSEQSIWMTKRLEEPK